SSQDRGFFFSSRRRHTRFSRDWSSACALPISVGVVHLGFATNLGPTLLLHLGANVDAAVGLFAGQHVDLQLEVAELVILHVAHRSEERRVGKECGTREPLEEEDNSTSGSERDQ